MNISLPFGSEKLSFAINEENLLYVATPNEQPIPDPAEIIEKALDNPLGSLRLEQMANALIKVAIIVDDLTRPTPKKLLLPHVLKRLRNAGVKDENIRLMIALGTHRQMTDKEIDETIGFEIAKRFRVVNNDYKIKSSFTNIGKTLSGIPVEINSELMEADLKIGIGNIVPHIDAGFGGGVKIIQPGMCSETTTAMTHYISCTKQFVLDVCGNAENRCRHEMELIGRKVGLDFIVNTVLDERKNLLGVFCGDMIYAHRVGVELSKKVFCPEIPARADIVIASANPCEIDFWQGAKAYIHALFGVKKGGTLILAIRAPEGLAGNAFNHDKTLRAYSTKSYEDMCYAVDNGLEEDVVGLNVPLYLAVTRDRAHTIIVSEGMNEQDAQDLGFDYCESIESALRKAYREHGMKASIGVIPFAGETLVMERK